MKLGIIGITGRLGTRLAKQALNRGWQVIGFNRRSSRWTIRLGDLPVEKFVGDTDNINDIIKLMEQCDVVIHATAPTREHPERYLQGIKNTLSAAEQTHLKKLIILGNSFSLIMANGKTFMDNRSMRSNFAKINANWPAAFQAVTTNEKVNWTYAIPAVDTFPYGDITHKFIKDNGHLTDDVTMSNIEKKSRISMEDFAALLLDIAENDTDQHAVISAHYLEEA